MFTRTTVVVTTNRRHSWNLDCILFVRSPFGLHVAFALRDVERIILDRAASAGEFLRFLAALPSQAVGDVMSLRADGGAFLSAVGPDGHRVLASLGPADVASYLAINRLMAAHAGLALAA